MNCLSESQIQAFLDAAMETTELEAIRGHLDCCEACSALYEDMKSVNAFSGTAIESLLASRQSLTTALSPSPVKGNQAHRKERKTFMKTYQRYIATAAAVCLLVAGFTIEPVKAAVSDAVSIFRAKDIQSVDISLEDLRALESALSENKGNIDIENLAKVEAKGGESKNVTLDEAQAGITFKLKPLKGLENQMPRDIYLTEAAQMTFRLNVEKVNSLMKTLGATTFFSQDLNDKPFSIYTAGTVSMAYELARGDQNIYLQYVQTKFPEVTAPAGTSVKALTDAIASLGVLPPALQSQIKSMSDVDETLYLPNINGALDKISIGGVTYFVQFDQNNNYFSNAIWLEDGTLRMLSGNFDRAGFEKLILGE